VDGVDCTAPHTFDWAPGEVHTIAAGAASLKAPTAICSRCGAMAARSNTTSPFRRRFDLQRPLHRAIPVRTAVSPAGGGSLTVSPASPDGYYTVGTMLRLTATPAAGFNFLQWAAGAGGTIYQILNWQGRSSNPTDLALLQNDFFYIATFTQSPSPSLLPISPAGW